MGQYWIPVNVTRREYVDPHRLGAGLKLWEQLANHPGTASALVLLLAGTNERRGGGDIEAPDVVGRWAGDKVLLVGDYAEKDDLKGVKYLDCLYELCSTAGEYARMAEYWRTHGSPERAKRHAAALKYYGGVFTDIGDKVAKVLEVELGGKFSGEGGRTWTQEDR
jgi:hypothetical protein